MDRREIRANAWRRAWHAAAIAAVSVQSYFIGMSARGCSNTWDPLQGVGGSLIFFFLIAPALLPWYAIIFGVFRFVGPRVNKRRLTIAWAITGIAAIVLYIAGQLQTRYGGPGGCSV